MLTVNLKDIGDAGQEFSYSPGQEEDLDKLLKSLFGELPEFKAEFSIVAIGDVFIAKGFVQSQMIAQCSLCGEDMNSPIQRKFSEYLVKEEPRSAEGHAPHSGLDIDNEQEVTFFKSYEFNLGNFLREQFAVAMPDYPKCEDEKACENRQKENSKFLDVEPLKQQGHPAFSVLSQLKKH